MRQMNVKMVGTTDDPIDDLRHHRAIADDHSFDIKVLPSWRPDKAFTIDAPGFNDYLRQLEAAADIAIGRFSTLCDALYKRMDHFAAHGCKVADHALDVVVFGEADEATLDAILLRRLNGELPTPEQSAQFKSAVLLFWPANTGAAAGCSNITSARCAITTAACCRRRAGYRLRLDQRSAAGGEPLSRLLDARAQQGGLPKTILYCLNPRDNEVIGTMIGNFQGKARRARCSSAPAGGSTIRRTACSAK